jgi:hypothetical protein
MIKYIFLLFLVNALTKCLDHECAVQVLRHHVQYKSFQKSKISEDTATKNFQLFSKESKEFQMQMVERLIMNFELLPMVRLYTHDIRSRVKMLIKGTKSKT